MTERKTVLIVDDEPDIRTFLGALLEDNGYQVHTAENGADAWKQVQASRPDLVTLDVTMPEESGVRFYRDLRESEALKDVPVVMVTGVDASFEKFISTRRQVPPPDGYHRKPVDPEKLLAEVQKLLAK